MIQWVDDAAVGRPSVIASLCSLFALLMQFLIGGSSCPRSRFPAVRFLALTFLFVVVGVTVVVLGTALSPAQAQYPGSVHGTYVWSDATGKSPNYSGGQSVTDHGSGAEAPVPYGPRDASAWGGQANGWGGQTNGYPVRAVGATCSGPITTTFTWKPNPGNPNEPPPSSVIVVQKCMAQCYLSGGTSSTGSYATGLGKSGSANGQLDTVRTLYDTLYTAQTDPGASFSIAPPCSPSVSATAPPAGACSGLVEYSATVIVPLLQAHSIKDTANWDDAHPRFFSGTNCRVSGTALAYSAPPGSAPYPDGGSYVKEATLSIGGTLVKSYHDTALVGPVSPNAAQGTNQSSVPLSVVFDSTHFSDGSAIPALLTVTDSGGLTYTVKLSGRADNELLSEANQTSSWVDYQITPPKNVSESAVDGDTSNGQPYSGVNTQSATNNFLASKRDIDHKSDLITRIGLSGWTVFFTATHSNHGLFGDCYSTTTSDVSTYLFDADVQSAIAARTSTYAPPYLFVYIHGCDGGGSPTLANDFGIATTSSDDRACAGYGATIVVNQQNTNFVVDMWHHLLGGDTLDDATFLAGRANPVQLYRGPNTPPDNAHTTAPVIYGDKTMTLHNKVYQWVSGPTWYK